MKRILSVLFALLLWSVQAQDGVKSLNLDAIVDGDFSSKGLPTMSFMKDGEHYAQLVDGERIVKYALATGKEVDVLLSPDRLKWEGEIEGFCFSEDNRYLLFYTQKEKIYRHSFKASYYLFDLRLNQLMSIAEGRKIRAAVMTADASKLAYVDGNNIFIFNRSFNTTRQITDDGIVNEVINGVPDWVYEEEFATDRLMEWSPDGRFLAWIRFDESQVPEYSFPYYYQEKNDIASGYLDRYVYKYPKAGATNSTVSAHVFDYDNKVSRQMKVDVESEEVYLPRLFWGKTADKLGIARLNRHQNDLQILFANPKSGVCTITISEKNKYYIDQANYSDIAFLEDGEHFVYQSERDGYNHLYLYAMSGRLVTQLTKGDYDVTAYYGYDAKAKVHYFQAAKKTPLEREVYALNAKKVLTCLSTEAGFNAKIYTPNFNYSISTFSSAKKPFQAKVLDEKGSDLYTIVDNDALIKKLEKYKFTPKSFFTFDNGLGDVLNGWMMKPLDFDENKKYPVLMVQYSGPGSQQVSNSFTFGWENYLAQQGYVVVCVDGRGTGFRGEEFKKCTYMQLGRYESDDQIAAAQYIKILPYVDGDRLAIWGWSYGGFMSALCMSRGEGVFKAGIAVAPVTHYKFYDSAYTERFMRTPQENPDGYNNYSPLMLAEQLQGRLLLCHGTADDNVHYQNSIEYAEALVQAGKQFEMQTYRNRNHSISGDNTRRHLYHRFVDFLEGNL